MGLCCKGQSCASTCLQSLETSLRQLQTEAVDLWQIHNVDERVLATETQRRSPKFSRGRGAVAKRVGVADSVYGRVYRNWRWPIDLFDTLQVTYSVFDQRLTAEVLPLAQEKNVGVMVRSFLLKGALTEHADHLPDHLEPLHARSRQFRQFRGRVRLAG